MFASHLASSAEQAPERDLACVDIWTRSIERSRRRRELAAVHRKHAPRRKASSLALSAALLASPMVPLASAQSGGSGATGSEESGPGEGDRVRAGDAILRSGDTGSAVVAVQQKLAVDADGAFGPVTEDAVEDFQGRVGLSVTGEVDSRTWTELFRAAVSFVPEGSPEAKAIQASVSGDTEAEAEPAEPEAEARATTAVAPDDDAEPAPPRDTAPSDDVEADDTDDAADDTQGDDSDADD
ncbi:MAG: peptidoglycan-binding domain-containing protein, partial [Solirubrobacteraceae bacterium]